MKKLKLWQPGSIATGPCKCSWCQYHRDPGPEGICHICHVAFKQLLCSSRWTKLRQSYLNDLATAFCRNIFGNHTVPVPTEEIDHIQGWRFFPSLFWEETNLQPLCRPCHLQKTRIDGSYKFDPRQKDG